MVRGTTALPVMMIAYQSILFKAPRITFKLDYSYVYTLGWLYAPYTHNPLYYCIK